MKKEPEATKCYICTEDAAAYRGGIPLCGDHYQQLEREAEKLKRRARTEEIPAPRATAPIITVYP